MPNLDNYFQITEAAEYLGVCKNTLRNWGQSGKIAEHRHPINNYRLFRKRDLDLLIKRIAEPKPKPR